VAPAETPSNTFHGGRGDYLAKIPLHSDRTDSEVMDCPPPCSQARSRTKTSCPRPAVGLLTTGSAPTDLIWFNDNRFQFCRHEIAGRQASNSAADYVRPPSCRGSSFGALDGFRLSVRAPFRPLFHRNFVLSDDIL
jgi:hypothetical protein